MVTGESLAGIPHIAGASYAASCIRETFPAIGKIGPAAFELALFTYDTRARRSDGDEAGRGTTSGLMSYQRSALSNPFRRRRCGGVVLHFACRPIAVIGPAGGLIYGFRRMKAYLAVLAARDISELPVRVVAPPSAHSSHNGTAAEWG